jgi:hypothetical protein
MTFVFEDPAALAGRLKIGREEFAQRLLTSLILDGPYPRWNTRSTPSPDGMRFLELLYQRSFGAPLPDGACEFVDEFELKGRAEGEKGGAPDYAVLWSNSGIIERVWIVELKTEPGSHRHDQIPGYFALAAHHYPGAAIEITYLTAAKAYAYDAPRSTDRYSHLRWSEIVDDVRSVWGDSGNVSQQTVVGELDALVDDLVRPAKDWRERLGYHSPPLPLEQDSLAQALCLSDDTADDGVQRAIETEIQDLDELLQLRAEVRAELAASPPGSPRRRVMPWIWRWESTGPPRTENGAATGYEIRLSRYEKDLY